MSTSSVISVKILLSLSIKQFLLQSDFFSSEIHFPETIFVSEERKAKQIARLQSSRIIHVSDLISQAFFPEQ